jgi:hypothetical protein
MPAPPASEPPATEPASSAASEPPDTAAAHSDSQSANEVNAEITTVATTTALDATTDSGDTTLDEELELSRWARCPPVQYRSVDTPTSETGAVELQADNAQARDNNIFILEGNAVAQMDRATSSRPVTPCRNSMRVASPVPWNSTGVITSI